MTREQLIEKLWEEQSLPFNGHVRVMDESSFLMALNAALDAQARGCAEKWMRDSLILTNGAYERTRQSSPRYANILTADPEVEEVTL